MSVRAISSFRFLPELVKDGEKQPLVTLIVTGDSDPYCKESAINYSDYMSSHGINHIFYIRPGAHEVSVWNQSINNIILTRIIFCCKFREIIV